MKHHTFLITAALLVGLFVGCSKGSSNAQPSKDLGVVEISNGVSTRHDLGGGKCLVVVPEVFTNGRVRLALTVEEQDSKGIIQKSEAQVQTSPDIITHFSLADIDFSLKAHIKP